MNAVTVEKQPGPVVELRVQLDQMGDQFKAALPAHIPLERFMRVVITAIQSNPELLDASRKSLFEACMKAAQDGLLPDGREGAMVIRRDRKRGKIVVWQPMIAGIRKKVRNSGEIADWNAEVVFARDAFEYEKGDEAYIRHRPYLGPDDPGPIIAAYSIAKLKNGEIAREVMTIRQIEKVRDRTDAWRAYQEGAIKSTPWSEWPDEMARKTVARRHSKSLPMSSDLDDLIRRDDDLYDLAGAREEAQADRPRSLTSKLDALADFSGESEEGPRQESEGEAQDGRHDETPQGTAEAGEATGEAATATETANKPEASFAPNAKERAARKGKDAPQAAAEPDSVEIARQRGRDAHKAGAKRSAIPGEYRVEGMEPEAKAWSAGWREEFDKAEPDSSASQK